MCRLNYFIWRLLLGPSMIVDGLLYSFTFGFFKSNLAATCSSKMELHIEKPDISSMDVDSLVKHFAPKKPHHLTISFMGGLYSNPDHWTIDRKRAEEALFFLEKWMEKRNSNK